MIFVKNQVMTEVGFRFFGFIGNKNVHVHEPII